MLRVDGDPFMMKAEDNNVLIVVALMSNEVNKNIYETYIHYLSDLWWRMSQQRSKPNNKSVHHISDQTIIRMGGRCIDSHTMVRNNQNEG